MSNKTLTISLVIPAYNEESHLEACLEAVQRQLQPFHEIIVVDNNSSDDTASIARSFQGVRVIQQPKQGVVHARDMGFGAARGDIIARIDADTLLPTDWTQQLQRIFKQQDVAAVSGKIEYYDISASRLLNGIDLFFRRYFALVLGREVALQGANMAMRRDVWKAIQHETCSLAGLHEDFDLAIHANRAGNTVVFDEGLVAAIGYRQAASTFRGFYRYARICPDTYRHHGLASRRWMYPVLVLALLCFGILKILYRGYDAETQRFSLIKLFSADLTARVNPATYVD